MIDERQGLPSASKRERWSKCPGSFELESLIPATPSGEAAERGNRIHDALHTGDFSVLNEEEAGLAEKLRGLEELAVAQWRKIEGGTLPLSSPQREQRLGLKIDAKLILTGKPDAIYASDSSILVLDYKTGMVPVDSTENLQ